jgi:hypothetical protein
MIEHKFQNGDGETVEVWLSDNCPHVDEINRLVDIQLDGIKSFYLALQRDGKIFLGGEA